jgi:hypothetical protein
MQVRLKDARRPPPGFFHEHRSGDVELRSRRVQRVPDVDVLNPNHLIFYLELVPSTLRSVEANELGNEARPRFAAGADGRNSPRESRLRWNSKQSRIS